jgi:hypothetical protein
MTKQSKKVGWGQNGGTRPICLFEALVDLECADCGGRIAAGEIFTRAVREYRVTAPVCLSCRPVTLLATADSV